jgi:hypothetical protein
MLLPVRKRLSVARGAGTWSNLMRKNRLFAATLLIVIPGISSAQEARPMPDRSQMTRPAPGRPDRPDRPQIQPPRPGTGGPQIQPPRPGTGGPQIQPPRPGTGGPQIQPPRPGTGGPQIQPPRPGTGGPQIQPPRPGRPQPPRPVYPTKPVRPTPPGGPHRPGAGRPPHFRPVPARPFRYPHGYAYRRWTIGLLLPHLFLSSVYYYDQYRDLGVGAPPPGYRWVRYGPDLLLVNTRTGRISDAIYGAFY